MTPASEPAATVRLDLWLWAARFFKTRALAKQAIESGRARVDGQACKASRGVRIGDHLQIERGEERFEIAVLALSGKRGPASAAQLLYAESDEARARREAARAERAAARAGYQPPAGKPDKRSRRLIQALGDIDAL
ncbi:RNA-binding S4 domain-containing protein [Chiayiivirga flava]|uniref:Heat shock protein 15 n=1 Tax=Chiayiivirga flava TaxID=659595 RepID=A0A7W8G0E2_9GAMM|nr:RNA-binding S4 domain-containing protein [Chiayiivirga flava]MBB5209392.1 ribosome-associated heat shock protein Hsp15 [Chiayiivirga flava]